MAICGYTFSQLNVSSTGNVCVGGTTFDVKLRVNGDFGASRVATSNIGIGYGFASFNPAYRLQVSGDGQFVNGSSYLKIRPITTTINIGSNLGALHFWESVTGFNKLYGSTYYNHSDARAKEDILPVENATSILKQLKTYSYYFKSEPVETRKKDYGILAQEIEELLPDLVYTVTMEDSLEYKLVNYNGFIAFLIKGFNEQQIFIEQQRKEIEILQNVVLSQEREMTELKELQYGLREVLFSCCANPKSLEFPALPEEKQQITQEKAILYQNTPNPFTSNTEIEYELFAAPNHAAIYIYNLQGMELRAYPVTQIGLNSIIVQASDLPAGMYLYTLVVDNEIVDTKRMILTK